MEMYEIIYSKKFDKIVKSELKMLGIKTGEKRLEGNKIILEVEKFPSKSKILIYKTDYEMY